MQWHRRTGIISRLTGNYYEPKPGELEAKITYFLLLGKLVPIYGCENPAIAPVIT